MHYQWLEKTPLIRKIKRVYNNMAIFQRQNSKKLLTLWVKLKAPKSYRPRANVKSKSNLIRRTYLF